MSDFDRNLATARSGYRTDQVAIDAGLRAYMIRVYNYMTAGVALTGVVAWLAYQAAGGDAIVVTLQLWMADVHAVAFEGGASCRLSERLIFGRIVENAAGGFDQELALADVVRAGLLDVDMLARLAGEDRRGGVPVVGGGDGHGIDGLVVEQAEEVGIGLNTRNDALHFVESE